jgi:hypothetical protein
MRVNGDRSPIPFEEGDPIDFVVFILDVVDGERRLSVARSQT